MKSQNKNLVFVALLACFLGLTFVPGALADNQIIKPLSTEPANMAYTTETGQFYEGLYFLPIVKEAPTVAGIMFHGLGVTEDTLINNANMSLRFSLQPSAGSCTVSVYGINSNFGQNIGFYGASDLLNAELSGAHVDLDLGSISGDQWLEVDITDIVQEIVNKNDWTLYDNVGIVFLSTGGTERAISTNSWITSTFPSVNVTFGEDPGDAGLSGPDEEAQPYIYNSTHGDYTIYQASGNWSPLFYADTGEEWFTVKSVPYGDNLTFTAEIQTNYSTPGGFTKLEGTQSIQIQGNYIYTLFKNSGTPEELCLVRTLNNGFSWEFIANYTHISSLDTAKGALIYNDVLEVWHIFYQSHSIRTYYIAYDPGADEFSGGQLLHTAYNAHDKPIGGYVDQFGGLYIGFAGQASSTSRKAMFKHLLDGVWDGNNLDNYYLTLCTGAWVDGYTAPSGEEYLMFFWSWGDLSGTSDNSVWIRVLKAGDDIDLFDDTIEIWGGDPSVEFTRATINTFWRGEESVFDSDGTLYILGDRQSGGKYCPALCVTPFQNEVTPWAGGQDSVFTAAYAGPPADQFYGALYLNPITDEPGIMSSASAGAFYKYWIDPAMINGTYWNETAYTINSGAFGWLSGGKTPAQWAKKAVNTWNTSDNHVFLTPNIETGKYWGEAIDQFLIYKNGTLVTSPCLDLALTVQDIENCLDIMDPDNIDSDEPNPGGWDDSGPGTRPNIILYYLVLGLSFIIFPIAWLARSREFAYLYVVLFLNFIGVALLLAMSYV